MNENELATLVKLGAPVLVAIVAYVVNTLLKSWFDFESVDKKKWCPIINAGIGLIAAVIGMFIGVLQMNNAFNIFVSIVSCLIYALGAGGFHDLVTIKLQEKQESNTILEKAIKQFGTPPSDIPQAPVNHEKNDAVDQDKEVTPRG